MSETWKRHIDNKCNDANKLNNWKTTKSNNYIRTFEAVSINNAPALLLLFSKPKINNCWHFEAIVKVDIWKYLRY